MRELEKEAIDLANWGNLEEKVASKMDDQLYAASRLILAEAMLRVALAIERAEEAA